MEWAGWIPESSVQSDPFRRCPLAHKNVICFIFVCLAGDMSGRSTK